MKEQDLRDKIINAESRYFQEALIEKCVQIAKDYAESQNKELIIAFKNFVSATTKEFSEINGFGQQRKRAVFLIEKYQLFKNRENER